MRASVVLALMLAAVLVGLALTSLTARAHDDDDDDDDDEDGNDHGQRFVVTLSGNEEVPARDTRASGKAQFRANGEETELSFRLSVSRIKNVFAAHIHCGAPGVNGPIGVTLFGPVAPGGGRVSGVLAKGVITAADAGNSCGWTDLASVLAAIRSGDTYVNVHTNDGVAPVNTGPGDFPGGEIRGHVVSVLDDDELEFAARLRGANEVPARETRARGQAHIRVDEDMTEIHFRVTVRRITNVFMAHIHCAAAGTNGPIGVTLYGVAPTGGGPFSGLLVKAMASAPDAGNACGWTTLEDVVAAMEGGNAYVNVHTNDGVDPANTGPGDFPGGEVRGQLRAEDDD
ncbi:MAG: CHRD domain-containing protein [Thermoplasmata archaeon]